jgi:hypothetical protein
MPEQKQSEKVVILHGVVSHGGRDFRRGEVVSRDDLRHTHRHADGREEVLDAHDRLASLGAVRPATEAESGQPAVDAGAAGLTPLSPAPHQALAAKDATIERLTRLAGDLQGRADAARRLGAAVAGALPPPPEAEQEPGFDLLAREKDARIEALLARVKGLEEQTAGREQEQREAAPQGPKVSEGETAREAFQAQAEAPQAADVTLEQQPEPPPPEEETGKKGRKRGW